MLFRNEFNSTTHLKVIISHDLSGNITAFGKSSNSKQNTCFFQNLTEAFKLLIFPVSVGLYKALINALEFVQPA
jgi:hypothetical protein